MCTMVALKRNSPSTLPLTHKIPRSQEKKRIIKILYKEDDTWWCGEFNGKKGMFPKDFVDLLNH